MSTPQTCSDSFLEYYERTTNPLDRRQTFCDATPSGGDRRTASNTAYFRLYSESVERMPFFSLVYTRVSPGQQIMMSHIMCVLIAAMQSGVYCAMQILFLASPQNNVHYGIWPKPKLVLIVHQQTTAGRVDLTWAIVNEKNDWTAGQLGFETTTAQTHAIAHVSRICYLNSSSLFEC